MIDLTKYHNDSMTNHQLFRLFSAPIIGTLLITIFSLTNPVIVLGQDMPIPIDLQLSIFEKILSFDRNLHDNAGDEIVLGVIYQSRYRKSLNTKDQILDEQNKQTIGPIKGLPVRVFPIELIEISELETSFVRNDIDILYITPLRAIDISTITKIAHSSQVLSLSGVPNYINEGVAVSVGTRGEKPQIIINLPATKEAGVDFSSQLLKLASILD